MSIEMESQSLSLVPFARPGCRPTLSVVIVLCLLASGISNTSAVPTDNFDGSHAPLLRPQTLLQRALRDVTAMANLMVDEQPKDLAPSTESNLDQPQGHCLLDGILVAETTVFCEKQVGCRAIQKTGHCCPDYKCDCEKDGKTYSNGDKLVDPETPCTVCYCQGGEILCSSVSCFHRDDCTPKYIPGRCCPEYDNCPVIKSDNMPSNTNANTNSNRSTQPTAANPQPDKPNPADFPKTITIKEITKPTEIRITDDNKSKPIHQMFKPTSTEPTTSTSATPTFNTNAAISTPKGDLSDSAEKAVVTQSNESKASVGTNTESLKLSASTSYEKTQLIPVDLPSQTVNNGDGRVDVVDASSTTQRPIDSFNSQELQTVQGELANDSAKVNIKRENMLSTEGPAPSSTAVDLENFESAELVLSNADFLDSFLAQKTSDTDPETAGSDNIYHIILTTDGPRLSTTTEHYSALNVTITNVDHDNETLSSSSEADSSTMERVQMNSSMEHDGVISPNSWTAEPVLSSSTDGDTEFISSSTHTHLDDDDSMMPIEYNPAYPSLPEDDFSLRDVNFPLSETDDIGEADIKDEQRSIGHSYEATKVAVKQVDDSNLEHLDGSGSEIDAVSSTTEGDVRHAERMPSTTDSPTQKQPQAVYLMESVEESSAETTISNSTDFQLEQLGKGADNAMMSEDSFENEKMEAFIVPIDSGSGSGSGGGFGSGGEELLETLGTRHSLRIREREPTTPKPTQKPAHDVDIDEIHDGSGDHQFSRIDDPKLDAESLKIDETSGDDAVISDAQSKGNILSIKLNHSQDRAFAESDHDHEHGHGHGHGHGDEHEHENNVGRVQRLYLHRVF